MGIFQPYRRRTRRFDQVHHKEKRIEFRRLSPYHRDKGRSLIGLAIMLALVIYLFYYLSQI